MGTRIEILAQFPTLSMSRDLYIDIKLIVFVDCLQHDAQSKRILKKLLSQESSPWRETIRSFGKRAVQIPVEEIRLNLPIYCHIPPYFPI